MADTDDENIEVIDIKKQRTSRRSSIFHRKSLCNKSKTNDIDKKKKAETKYDKEEKEDVKINNKKAAGNKKEVQKIKPPAKKRVKEDNVDEDEAKEEKEVKSKNAAFEESEKDESEDDDNESETDRKSVPLLDQPLLVSGSRVRKGINRLSLEANAKLKSQVDLVKGSGTPLGEVPRIEANMANTKIDDMRTLYKICFGGQAKATIVKKHLRQFNGFGFDKDSDQYKKKKASLSKYTRADIKTCCAILDLQKSGKKDDLIEKLLSFLIKPIDSGKKVPDAKAKKKSIKGGLKDSKEDFVSARNVPSIRSVPNPFLPATATKEGDFSTRCDKFNDPITENRRGVNDFHKNCGAFNSGSKEDIMLDIKDKQDNTVDSKTIEEQLIECYLEPKYRKWSVHLTRCVMDKQNERKKEEDLSRKVADSSTDFLDSSKHVKDELMSKLTHYNMGVRLEALSGLKELAIEHPTEVLKSNLTLLLDSTAQLIIDGQSEVRLAAIDLLRSILKQVSVDQLIPLYPILVSYLICGVTHIGPRIQEDSLKLLDILMSYTPELISQDAQRLLPHFLDLMSHTSTSGRRALSIRIEGKMAAAKWRSGVLFRLRRLLAGMLESNKKDSTKNNEKVVLWDHKKYTYVSLYPRLESNESVFTAIGLKGSSKHEIKDYVEVLMPLLCDTFVEAVPQKKEDTQNQGAANLIPAEAAALLQCIIDIIFILWQLLQQLDNAKDHTEWFRSTYSQLICSRLMSDRFPYSTTLYGIKRKHDESLTLLESPKDVDTTCLQQNLGLCHLTFLLCNATQYKPVWYKCMSFINNCLITSPRMQHEECVLLRKCFLEVSFRGSETESMYLVGTVAHLWVHQSKDNALENATNNVVFDFLCYVALEPKLQHVHRENGFEKFLNLLPYVLTKQQVSYTVIETLNKIAAHNNRVFSSSLDSSIEAILDNIVTVQVTGCESQIDAKKSIVNLLFWVKEWDQDMVNNLENAIMNCYFGRELTDHILDIISLRLQYGSENVKKLFRSIPRWQDVILPDWHQEDI